MAEIPTGADGAESLAQVEHSSPAKAKRVVLRQFNPTTGEFENASSTNPIPSNSPAYATRIDEASATVTYIGSAVPGTAASAASWQIKKIDSSSGTIINFADGTSNFTKVWNDRASYTYS